MNKKSFVFFLLVLILLFLVYLDYGKKKQEARSELAFQMLANDVQAINVKSMRYSYSLQKNEEGWFADIDGQFYQAQTTKVESLINQLLSIQVRSVSVAEAETLDFSSGSIQLNKTPGNTWMVSATTTIDGGSFVHHSESQKVYYSDTNWEFLFLKSQNSFIDPFPLKFKIDEVKRLEFNGFEISYGKNGWNVPGVKVNPQQVSKYLDGLFQLKSDQVLLIQPKRFSSAQQVYALQMQLANKNSIDLQIKKLDNTYWAKSSHRKVYFSISEKDVKSMQWRAKDFAITEGDKK